MGITSTIIDTATLGTTTSTTVDENGKFNLLNNKRLLGTSIASSASAITANINAELTDRHIHEKSAEAYVESLSDEELEAALIQLGELDNETTNDFTSKK